MATASSKVRVVRDGLRMLVKCNSSTAITSEISMLLRKAHLWIASRQGGWTFDVKAAVARWQVFVFLLAVLVSCYSPVLVTSYAVSDEHAVLAARLQGKMTEEKALRIAGGRPLDALLISFFFSYVNDIGELRYLRLLSVIGITLLAWSVYRTLRCVGWSSSLSVFLSVIICVMPPFQQYASWAVSLGCPFAAVASGCAFSLAEQGFEEGRPLYKWSLTVGAILLELLALTIYQPIAMFFWVFVVILLFEPSASLSDVLRRFGWYSAIVLTALILGFGVYKFGLAMSGYQLPPMRSHLVQDVGEKVSWFFREPLTNALNLARLSANRRFALSMVVFLFGGLMLYFPGGIKERLYKLLVALLVFPLSYLPNLVVAESWSAYRTLSALMSVVVVYIFFALWGYGRTLHRSTIVPALITITLGFFALSCSLLAAYNVNSYFASPLSLELMVMRGQLAQQDLTQVHTIYAIAPGSQDSIARKVRYDEFGQPFSSSPWGLRSAVYLLLRELSPQYADIPIELVSAKDSIKPLPGVLVVDMRNLSSFRKNARREEKR